MRPVGAPEHAVAELGHQLSRERNRVLVGRRPARDALRAAHLDPELLVAYEIEQLSEGRLIDAERRIHPSHVVDDDGNRGTLQPGRELVDQRAFEMDLQMPAELRESTAERDRLPDADAFAQMLHEIEPHAAES